jgi:hypothetical protein
LGGAGRHTAGLPDAIAGGDLARLGDLHDPRPERRAVPAMRADVAHVP